MTEAALMIHLYRSRMQEIVYRLRVVDQICAGSPDLLYDIVRAECAYLQLRQVLELIATASLVVTESDSGVITQNCRRDWHAGDILTAIKNAHPDYYYPEPLRVINLASAPPIRSGNYQGELVACEEDYLTIERFQTLYDISSRVLHVPNPFSSRAKPKDDATCRRLLADAQTWTRRIIALITHHRFKFVKRPDHLFLCHTVGSQSQPRFEIAEFEPVDGDGD